MSQYLGLIFSFGALLFWTLGDFFIQRTVRKVGDIHLLFYIGIIGSILLWPFIGADLADALNNSAAVMLLILTGVVIFAAAIFDFEALKRGKISIIEPILSSELPVTVILSLVILHERVLATQLMLIVGAFIGILLSVISDFKISLKEIRWERGIIWGMVGALIMGLVNFLVGVSSQQTSALLAIWFTNIVFSLMCLFYMLLTRNLPSLFSDWRKFWPSITLTSVVDNGAWIFFALAVTYLPIAIVTTISESYIALTVLLGLFINREKVRTYQLLGVLITILCVIILSATTIY